jgi:small-conductance mechanosensitive channel
MILLLCPFQVGDHIEAVPVAGRIEEIGLFTIELTTEDGIYLSVSNSTARISSASSCSTMSTLGA